MAMQTFEELADEDLDRIEARAAAATTGPWFSYVAGRDPEADGSFIELGRCNEVGTFESIELVGATAADQDFIASARQDVPMLLRAVRCLRARLRYESVSNKNDSH
ncbi:hypothetical protein JM946_27885 [Steroidobacter sp. S1-65]|uniref:Uncharacterized protein n=1 Tax=Steroidobacter gossypii TaxID=2805490 RepID=A0ABS1X5S2_9GAMM|nr:hypothetical protein [Steroidobacter gossypii]MBM0108572.1 hypothetical protein [Steroidobacter gossypii]